MPPRFFPASSSASTVVAEERYLVNLPADVWDAISNWIPDEELKNLYSVTPAFLYRALKLRYESLEVRRWADIATNEMLERAKTPHCAVFVRRLGIEFDDLHQHGVRGRRGISAMNLAPHTTTLAKAQRFAQSAISSTVSLLSRPEPSPERTVALLLDVMPYLKNVESLNINCWDVPDVIDITPIFTIAWSSMGSNLTSLRISCNISNSHVLSASKPHLPNLTTLELEITMNISLLTRDVVQERLALRSHVAPFISSLAPQLVSFQLFTFPNADLSVLFNFISATLFRKLKHLGLRMPFNGSYQDLSGMLAFLSPSTVPVLEALHLRLNPTGAALDRSNEIPLGQLLTALANYVPVTFTNLRTLELFPTHLPEGREVLHTAIIRSAETLTSLSVRDRSFQPDEFTELVHTLLQCHRLRMLRINLSKLDISVLDLLAKSFPKLRKLTLAMDESSNVDEPSVSNTLFQDLATRDYSAWELRDVGFYRAGQFDGTLMEAFAQRVPSVTSFYGRGHMLSPEQTKQIATTPEPTDVAETAPRRWKLLCGCLSSDGFRDQN